MRVLRMLLFLLILGCSFALLADSGDATAIEQSLLFAYEGNASTDEEELTTIPLSDDSTDDFLKISGLGAIRLASDSSSSYRLWIPRSESRSKVEAFHRPLFLLYHTFLFYDQQA